MRQFRTQAIILNRTNYGEADRIISFLTPDHGKVKATVKGVRKQKSKLAGGIELFSVSDISFIPGRREIGTVVSTRLIKYYDQIVKNLDRTDVAYSAIKKLDKATEDQPEPAYFHLLKDTFEALDDDRISHELIDLWFNIQLIKLAGHTPNLHTAADGKKLSSGQKYNFDFEKMCFLADGQGIFTPDNIKLLRVGFAAAGPKVLQRVNQAAGFSSIRPLVQAVLQDYVRT